jgi:hypothetical protein
VSLLSDPALVPLRAKRSIFFKSPCPALGSSQLYIQLVSRAVSPDIKRPVHEADHSRPCSTEVKSEWSHTSVPSYTFQASEGETMPLPFALNSFRLLIQSCLLKVKLLTCVHGSTDFTSKC